MARFGQAVAAGLSDPNRTSRLFDAFYEVGATPGRVMEAIRKEDEEQKETAYLTDLARVVTEGNRYSAINPDTGYGLSDFSPEKYQELIPYVQGLIETAPNEAARERAFGVLDGLNEGLTSVQSAEAKTDINNLLSIDRQLEQAEEGSPEQLQLQKRRAKILEKNDEYPLLLEDERLERLYAQMEVNNRRDAAKAISASNALAGGKTKEERDKIAKSLIAKGIIDKDDIARAEDKLIPVLIERDLYDDKDHANRAVSEEFLKMMIDSGFVPEGTTADNKTVIKYRNMKELEDINNNIKLLTDPQRILEGIELESHMMESLERWAKEGDLDWNFIRDDVYNVVEEIVDSPDDLDRLKGLLAGKQKRQYPNVVAEFIRDKNPSAWDRFTRVRGERAERNLAIEQLFEASKIDAEQKGTRQEGDRYYVDNEEVSQKRFNDEMRALRREAEMLADKI